MRKSIESRMDRIMAKLLPPGSMARREYDLPTHLTDALQHHRHRTARIIQRAENRDGPGGAYGRLLAGDLTLPTMPAVLADALGLSDPPSTTADATTEEAAQAWDRYREGEMR